MRRISFLLLFLLVGSLLAAAPVRAETAYYALSFDGDDYILVHHSSSFEIFNGGATWEVLINPSNLSSANRILFKKGDSFYIELERAFTGYIRANLWYNGTNYPISTGIVAEEAKTQHIVIVVETDATNGATVKLYINGELKSTKTNANVRGIDVSTNDMYVFSGFEGKGYIARMWNRPLSNSEVQQIYNDPLNPPTNGLVLEYLPSSVDTVNGLWKDLSGQGNDGQIYGAEPVRVSIPNVTAWDSIQDIPISVYNLSISDTNGTVYIPWFMPLPYDTPVTLNVSAPGYYSSLYTVQAPMLSLNFTLVPIPTYVTVAKGAAVVYARGGNEGSFLDFLNLFKFWPGGDIGAKLMRLNIKGAVQSFFNDTTIPFLGIVVALLIWGGGVIMSWVYSGEPEFVALWGLALYLGLKDFIVLDEYLTMMNAVMVPFAFIIAMLYLKKVLDTFGGG